MDPSSFGARGARKRGLPFFLRARPQMDKTYEKKRVAAHAAALRAAHVRVCSRNALRITSCVLLLLLKAVAPFFLHAWRPMFFLLRWFLKLMTVRVGRACYHGWISIPGALRAS